MWAINNHTPYAATGMWGRDKDGVHEWIVAVKGTFDIKRDGKVALAGEQSAPLLLPEYNGEPGESSLRYDADLVGMKPTTDILVNGTAYAPSGRAAPEFQASLRVGAVQKTIKVVGNRIWKEGVLGSARSAVEPIAKVPIVYERAYGGFDRSNPDPKKQRMDPRNPVGCGLVAHASQPLPNFEYPGKGVDKAGPAGFGAIASYWSPRRELAGTYDEAWQKDRMPLVPMDWDPRSLLCSPADQRPQHHVHGGEPVELINLTPDGVLRFSLPKIYLTFSTLIGKRTEEHRGQATTVIIEPDQRRVILVWQTSVTCRTNIDYLEDTLVREKPYIR